MKNSFPVSELVASKIPRDENSDDKSKIEYLFQTGLQEILNIFIGIYTRSFFESHTCPSGFTSKFTNILSYPTLGSSLEFLIFLSSYNSQQSLVQLSEYLQNLEKKGQGVLSKMNQLRNRWTHPKEDDLEKIFLEANLLLDKFNLLDSVGRISILDDNRVCWVHNNDSINLSPFCQLEDNKIKVFKKFKEPCTLIFDNRELNSGSEFSNIWKEIRILDPLLKNPSKDEISSKLNNKITKFKEENIWWKEHLVSESKLVFLVNQGLLEGIMGTLKKANTSYDILMISISDKENPLELIAQNIGIRLFNNSLECVKTLKQNKIYIGLKTKDLSSKYFLRLLSWISDLIKIENVDNIKLIIERSEEQLSDDQNILWDRLPDDLDEIFNLPPKNKKSGLLKYQWQIEKPKRFKFF